MQKPASIWLFITLVITVPFGVYGLATWYSNRFEALPVLGAPGHVIADFNVKNQYNETVTLDTWKGKIVIVNYFFTHCPSICPKMVYQLKRVQAYSAINNLEIASFSVDPERDSVTRLKHYANEQGVRKKWDFLTGDKKLLYGLARHSFLITATDGDGGPTDFIHSENFVLIDTKKRIRGFYKGTDETSVNQLIKDLKKLEAESP